MFFAAVNHLKGPLRKQKFISKGRVRRPRLSVVIGRIKSILFVSVLQGSLNVAIIMIDDSEKCNR